MLVVDHGRPTYVGILAGLGERVGAKRVVAVDLGEPAPSLDGIPGTAAAVLAEVSAVTQVRALTIDEPDIEEVVRDLYAGSDR